MNRVSIAAVTLVLGLGLVIGGVVGNPFASAEPDPPNPGHSWSDIGDLPGTMWHSNNDGAASGLDADVVDGMDTGQTGTDYIPYADASGNVFIGTTEPQFDDAYTARLLVVGGILGAPEKQWVAEFVNNQVSDSGEGVVKIRGGYGGSTSNTLLQVTANYLPELTLFKVRKYWDRYIAHFENVNVGIGTDDPESTLQVVGDYIQFPTISGSAPLAADCDSSAEAGRVVVRTDGTENLYVCRGTGGWVGK